ncbi:MAG: hemolysin III, partial [Saprospiraceae bacterium]
NYLITLWGLILIGILYKIFLIGRWKWFSLAFYIFLGWMAVFIIPSMKDQMSSSVFYWILAGGVSYTTGTIFFAWEKLPYHHAIWHLFVLGGSAGHYVAMVYAYG